MSKISHVEYSKYDIQAATEDKKLSWDESGLFNLWHNEMPKKYKEIGDHSENSNKYIIWISSEIGEYILATLKQFNLSERKRFLKS